MRCIILLSLAAIGSFFACSPSENNKEKTTEGSNEWELQIVHSDSQMNWN
ncbi:hypothetical protein [Algoriphagus ratkowskyi]|nr:hypothetical protein [Algoriphagus ratkowskyi]